MQIAQVAVATPLRRYFDYVIPDALSDQVHPGSRVSIPFANRTQIGLVVSRSDHTQVPQDKLKSLLACLDPQPLLDSSLLALCRWCQSYYHAAPGDIYLNALPAPLRKKASPKIQREQHYRLTALGRQQDPQQITRAPQQAKVLIQLATGQQSRQALLQADCSAQALSALLNKGWIETLSPSQAHLSPDTPQSLNPEQHAALQQIQQHGQNFGVFVLDGITGSGKTEVYLQLIQQHLSQNQQILVLIPEIGLTPQTLARFQRRFQVPIALLHSGMNDSERLINWHQAQSGEATIVIGTRSAVFTPLPRLGLIIIDEEHDASFKQQDGCRYQGRDVAIRRAQLSHCPIVLGSATPASETLHNIAQGKYQSLQLRQRAGNAQLPSIELVDIRQQFLLAGLAQRVLLRIQETLAQGQQVLIFLNRRGYAPATLCHSCGWVMTCPRCEAKMTQHRQPSHYCCHHCGYSKPLIRHCPECGDDQLQTLGQGTEQLDSVLQDYFPQLTPLRIDRDSVQRKGELQRRLQLAQSGEAQLLIGTQMLAKGHHFPHLTLVVILEADSGLFSADFRASERVGQLITQVAGRAGRSQHPGQVIIQTHQPDHPLLQPLTQHDYGLFGQQLLQERALGLWPPFQHIALIRAESVKPHAPKALLSEASDWLSQQAFSDLNAFGPIAAPMAKRANRYRFQLLLQSTQRRPLHQALQQLLPQLERSATQHRCRWTLDIDPQDLY